MTSPSADRPTAATVTRTPGVPSPGCELSRHAVFAECPHCGGGMAPEHAHYRCTSCGWRDSCCD